VREIFQPLRIEAIGECTIEISHENRARQALRFHILKKGSGLLFDPLATGREGGWRNEDATCCHIDKRQSEGLLSASRRPDAFTEKVALPKSLAEHFIFGLEELDLMPKIFFRGPGQEKKYLRHLESE